MKAQLMNLKRHEIIEKVRFLLEPWAANIDLIDEIEEQTNLIADLGLDSIAILQLILGAEREFNISIKEHELDSNVFSKMEHFINIVEKKIHENN